MGIPKTMDNDIAVTDHCPGFGSVARYMAGTVRELGWTCAACPSTWWCWRLWAATRAGPRPPPPWPGSRRATRPTCSTLPSGRFMRTSSWTGWAICTASWAAWSWWPARVSTTTRASPSCPHLPDRALHVLRRCVLPPGAAGGAAAGHQGPQREAGHPGPGLHRLAVPGGCRRSRGGGPRGLPGGAGRGDGADGGLPPPVLRALPLRDLPGAHRGGHAGRAGAPGGAPHRRRHRRDRSLLRLVPACWGRSCRPWRDCSEHAVPDEPGRSKRSGRVFTAVRGKYDKTSYFSKPAGFVY